MSDEARERALPATAQPTRPRVVLAGLPRSGTTWLATALDAHPSVHLVNEPENRLLDVLGWLGTGRLGVVPVLAPGERERDYRTMWRVALAGGWPDSGVLGRAAAVARRVSVRESLPHALRVLALRVAGELGARRQPPAPVVLVKSVRTAFTLDWLMAEFAPALLVVWRHPLNITSSWLLQEWGTDQLSQQPPVRARFESTSLWPPPSGQVAATAWTVCAHLTILLETVARHPDALVLNHERSALAPQEAMATALDWMGLANDEATDHFIAANDRPGEGFAIQRSAQAEPGAWRRRLEADDVRTIRSLIDEFQAESPEAAARWPASPAVAS